MLQTAEKVNNPFKSVTSEQRRLELSEVASLSYIKAFVTLIGEIEEREKRALKEAEIHLLSGELDIREADYIRGFVTGLRWVVSAPKVAERRLNEGK